MSCCCAVAALTLLEFMSNNYVIANSPDIQINIPIRYVHTFDIHTVLLRFAKELGHHNDGVAECIGIQFSSKRWSNTPDNNGNWKCTQQASHSA